MKRIVQLRLDVTLCIFVSCIANYAWALEEEYVGSTIKPGWTCVWDPPAGVCHAKAQWVDEPDILNPGNINSRLRIYIDNSGPDTCRRVYVETENRADHGFGRGIAYVNNEEDHTVVDYYWGPKDKQPTVKLSDCIVGRVVEVKPGGGYSDESNPQTEKGNPKDATRQQQSQQTITPTNRSNSNVEDSFASAFALSPEQLQANAAAARESANSDMQSSSTNSQDAGGLAQGIGIVVGAYIAGRTGDPSRLVQAVTGKSAEELGFSNSQVAGGSGSGSCDAAKNGFQSDLRAASNSSDACTVQRAAVNTWNRHRASVANACSGTPNYAAMMKETDDYANQARQYVAQHCH